MLYRAGVDEAGRGCLAGAVIAAAVILDPRYPVTGLADSKTLNSSQRERLCRLIRKSALAWAVGRAEPSEIDHLNILQASLLAMQRAVFSLPIQPDRVVVDGNHLPQLPVPANAVIGGDKWIPEISAASIVAKVIRDHEMTCLEGFAPGYGIGGHKGYPTLLHRRQLYHSGASPWHRHSFRPVRELPVRRSE